MVAGIAKGGTTSLYYYLIQHREVCIPRKESFYFARNFYFQSPGDGPPYFRDKSRIVLTESDYDRFYEKCNAKAIGEVSTCYAYFYEQSIPLIKEKLGDIKIIFILRDPIARALSGYKHLMRLKRETLSFKEAIEQEPIRMKEKWDFMWYYLDVGFYYRQVKAFKENFSRVNVYLTEDLLTNPKNVMKDIYRLIEVDHAFVPDTSTKYNISDLQNDNFWFKYFFDNSFSNKYIKPLVKRIILKESTRMAIKYKLSKPAGQPGPVLDAEMKLQLRELYRNDILQLQSLIGRDLSHWLK